MPVFTALDKVKARKFADSFIELDSVRDQRLMNAADVRMIERAKDSTIDRIGIIDPREIQGRYVEATFDDIDFDRRIVSWKRYVINVGLDATDRITQVIDPRGPVIQRCVQGFNREKDRITYNAALGSVQEIDKDNKVRVLSAADDGVKTLSENTANYSLLTEVHQNWTDYEVPMEKRGGTLFPISGTELKNLLAEAKIINNDYLPGMNVVGTGNLPNIMKVDFVQFGGKVQRPILQVKDGKRIVPIMTPNSVCLAVWRNMSIKVSDRVDFHGVTQIEVMMIMGAIRYQGTRVQIAELIA